MASQPESGVASAYLAFLINKANGSIVRQERCKDVSTLRDHLTDLNSEIADEGKEGKYAVDWTLVTKDEIGVDDDE